jgi:hypothetical protein
MKGNIQCSMKRELGLKQGAKKHRHREAPVELSVMVWAVAISFAKFFISLAVL